MSTFTIEGYTRARKASPAPLSPRGAARARLRPARVEHGRRLPGREGRPVRRSRRPSSRDGARREEADPADPGPRDRARDRPRASATSCSSARSADEAAGSTARSRSSRSQARGLRTANRRRARRVVQIKVADLFRPRQGDAGQETWPGSCSSSNAVATSAGVDFVSIQPGRRRPERLLRASRSTLTFDGNYYDLTDFLFRLRNLVTRSGRRARRDGRLYTLDALDLHESPEQKFPQIEAVLTISAYSSAPRRLPTRPGRAARDDRHDDDGDHDDGRDDDRPDDHEPSADADAAGRERHGQAEKRKSPPQAEGEEAEEDPVRPRAVFLLLMVWQGPGSSKG